jgi:outer membrane immunogenic protein
VDYTTTGYFTPGEVDTINANGTGRVKPTGFTPGITLGYNWQRGHGFFGFEGDYNHFNKDEAREVTFTDPFCVGCSYTLRQTVDVGHLASARLRGGWANPHWLIYGTAGGSHTKFSYNEVFTDTFANAYESSWQSHSKGGFVWGGGVEAQWAKHWSIKAEWLHSHYSSMSGPGGTLTTTIAGVTTAWDNPFTHSANLSADVARVGLNFRF